MTITNYKASPSAVVPIFLVSHLSQSEHSTEAPQSVFFARIPVRGSHYFNAQPGEKDAVAWKIRVKGTL